MKSVTLAFIIPLCFVLAGATSAQPVEAGGSIEPDEQPVISAPSPAAADKGPSAAGAVRLTDAPEAVCRMIEAAAVANGLPPEFVTRVIWQESRFRHDAVGPVTRSGQHALGIAQFMPATAAQFQLLDPFDPDQAIKKSAAFLRALLDEFNNLGLAAAAYNAGPKRVHDWLARKRTLPSQTLAYVRIVTGRSAEEWTGTGPRVWAVPVSAQVPCADISKFVAMSQSHGPVRNEPAAVTITSTAVNSITQAQPKSEWAVQLVGDRSAIHAMAMYHQLQNKYLAILGDYQPVLIHTQLGRNAASWHRVRVTAKSRQTAEMLCSRQRTAGGTCLVQRN